MLDSLIKKLINDILEVNKPYIKILKNKIPILDEGFLQLL